MCTPAAGGTLIVALLLFIAEVWGRFCASTGPTLLGLELHQANCSPELNYNAPPVGGNSICRLYCVNRGQGEWRLPRGHRGRSKDEVIDQKALSSRGPLPSASSASLRTVDYWCPVSAVCQWAREILVNTNRFHSRVERHGEKSNSCRRGLDSRE